ncbi:YdbL family protein [Ectothiorhodospira lacustris]|uniref:YdbL family protein n=1 Tax=Ectothiorhodospira lacustris TaxID=2899127 RepID=UPI001EE8D0D3|nr:YdbL family protein [Ectothiorhodospira lacustris]MCG5500222.1 YdbL family protein [Ectothiorhodospira lacustris]MCG5509554.1 YdbL family protein [Ectothiorhodospira lacustris]MCG5521651.1 YdbL family protein [Ectothiorhodospira lacustris]
MTRHFTALPRHLAWFGTVLLLTACVTINIYFPAAAAEDAARTIVRDVLGETAQPAEDSPSAAPTAPDARLEGGVQRVLALILDAIIPPAQAQQANINIRTAGIDALRASMRSRTPALQPHFASGAIGFTRDGLVTLRDLNAVPLRDRAAVQRLVTEENADRNALYREIARANDRPEWESDIRSTFARVWVQEAPRGYWYQDERGQWRQK